MKLRVLHLKDFYNIICITLNFAPHWLICLSFIWPFKAPSTESFADSWWQLWSNPKPQVQEFTNCWCGKTLLLKTPCVCASTVGDGETKLGLNWKLPPWTASFHCARRNHINGWWRTVTNISAWVWILHAKILTYQTGGVYLCNSGLAVMVRPQPSNWI